MIENGGLGSTQEDGGEKPIERKQGEQNPETVPTPPDPVLDPEKIEARKQEDQKTIKQLEQDLGMQKKENSGEKTLDEAQEKKFLELKAVFEKEKQKEKEDPENPINKLSSLAQNNPGVIDDVLRSRSQYDQAINRLGVSKQQFEESLPELYKKGLVESYVYGGHYVAGKAF